MGDKEHWPFEYPPKVLCITSAHVSLSQMATPATEGVGSTIVPGSQKGRATRIWKRTLVTSTGPRSPHVVLQLCQRHCPGSPRLERETRLVSPGHSIHMVRLQCIALGSMREQRLLNVVVPLLPARDWYLWLLHRRSRATGASVLPEVSG